MSYSEIPFDQMSLMPAIGNHNCRHGLGYGNGNETSWGTANRARFYPIRLYSPTWARRIIFAGGNTTGSVDVGIYRRDGTLITSSGATTNANSVLAPTLSPVVLLTPGDYYLAMACSSGSSSIFASTPSAGYRGVMYMETAYTLPATATFAGMSNSIVATMAISPYASDL